MKLKTVSNNTGFILILPFVCCLLACEKEIKLDLPDTPTKLVVEGWIENGQRAEIILSHSVPYFSVIDSNSILDFPETHAKVTLFSNDEEEILTLKPNQNYFPPFVFGSIDIKGETGKTYTIEIISEQDTITATTSIVDPVELDSVWFAPDPGKESKGRLWIKLSDDLLNEDYYRLLYKRKGKDKTYISTNISTFSDVLINGRIVELGFLRGFSSVIDMEDENYFESGDTISVKFCTIDKVQFDFWNVYQSKMLASSNPLATSNNQLKSNVSGGLGIWTGYGATYYTVIAKP